MSLIGFHGKTGVGKDVAAKHCIARHGYVLGRFAHNLKMMLGAFYETQGLRSVEIERLLYGDLREVPCQYLGGKTPRHAMQTLGTEWGRNTIHPTLWVDAEVRRQNLMGNTNLVFCDVRFDNEAKAIRERGGLVVQILRNTGKEESGHPSEDPINPALIDHVIDNNGTLTAFRERVGELVSDFESI